MENALRDVRLLGPTDWRLLRDTRLRALRDSPEAFASQDRQEWRWGEYQWRQRFRTATWVVAFDRGDVIGIAGLVGDHPDEPEHVEALWVDPEHRNRGVCRSLLGKLIEVARAAELAELLLWVLDDNVVAHSIYVHLGFVWTGDRKPLDHGRTRFELRLRLAL